MSDDTTIKTISRCRIGAVTDSPNPSRYWSELKKKLSETEGYDEIFDEIEQLPFEGADGKMYRSDACNTETQFANFRWNSNAIAVGTP